MPVFEHSNTGELVKLAMNHSLQVFGHVKDVWKINEINKDEDKAKDKDEEEKEKEKKKQTNQPKLKREKKNFHLSHCHQALSSATATKNSTIIIIINNNIISIVIMGIKILCWPV